MNGCYNQWGKNMEAKYPWLRLRNVWTGKYVLDKEGKYMSWAEQIPQGWYVAFGEQMIDELNDLLVKYNFVDGYFITQIKEKFGSLRWYDNGFPQAGYEEYMAWEKKYEDLSVKTCIVCGAPGEIHRKRWIEPLCDEHNK